MFSINFMVTHLRSLLLLFQMNYVNVHKNVMTVCLLKSANVSSRISMDWATPTCRMRFCATTWMCERVSTCPKWPQAEGRRDASRANTSCPFCQRARRSTCAKRPSSARSLSRRNACACSARNSSAAWVSTATGRIATLKPLHPAARIAYGVAVITIWRSATTRTTTVMTARPRRSPTRKSSKYRRNSKWFVVIKSTIITRRRRSPAGGASSTIRWFPSGWWCPIALPLRRSPPPPTTIATSPSSTISSRTSSGSPSIFWAHIHDVHRRRPLDVHRHRTNLPQYLD